MDSYVTYFFWSTFNQADESDSEVDLTKFYSITVLESRKTVESGTTGLRTWLASHVLAQYLILNPGIDLFQGEVSCCDSDDKRNYRPGSRQTGAGTRIRDWLLRYCYSQSAAAIRKRRGSVWMCPHRRE